MIPPLSAADFDSVPLCLATFPDTTGDLVALIVGALAFGIILAVASEFWSNSGTLSEDEIESLTRKHRRNIMLTSYEFGTAQCPPDPGMKEGMQENVECVPCSLQFHALPSAVAALLKGKVHEWIAVAFLAGQRVASLWWCKGPDEPQEWSVPPNEILVRLTAQPACDGVAVFRSHPSAAPGQSTEGIPSPADLRSASDDREALSVHGVNLLEFICDGGAPHLYFASFPPNPSALQTITTAIRIGNHGGRWSRYRLRKELERDGKSTAIPGD